jgi:hypothetical protein
MNDRTPFIDARTHGLQKRQQTRVAGRTQCHLTNDQGVRCTAEIADPLADHGLCIKHLAHLIEYVTHVQQRIAQGATS